MKTKLRLIDLGYKDCFGHRYIIQKKIFGIWWSLYRSDLENVARMTFNSIINNEKNKANSTKVLREIEI